MLDWQKSSYCAEGSNCLGLAAAPDGSIRLRESDAPDTLLRTTRAGLADLLRAAKAGEFDRAGG